MNILMVTPSLSPAWGGTTTSFINYYKAIREKFGSSSVRVVSGENELDMEPDVSIKNDKNIVFQGLGKNVKGSLLTSVKIIVPEVSNADFVWVHGVWTLLDLLVCVLCIFKRVPFMVTPHGMLNPEAMKIKALKKTVYWHSVQKWVLSKSSIVHCLTQKEAECVSLVFNGYIVVIPNLVRCEEFVDSQYVDVGEAMFVGRLHPVKAVENILEACSKSKIHTLHVVGSGDSDYVSELKKYSKSIGLDNRVIFHGHLPHSEIKSIYSKSAFLILASYTEAMSMVLIESLMNSTPVLYTDGCGFPEIDANGGGVEISGNSAEYLAKGIDDIQSRDLTSMAANGYGFVNETYSESSVSVRIENVINRSVSLKSEVI